jgi:hypothetical protein
MADWMYWMKWIFKITAVFYLFVLPLTVVLKKKNIFEYCIRLLNVWCFFVILLGVCIKTFAILNAWIQLGRMPTYRDALESGLKFRYIFNHYYDEILSILTWVFFLVFIIPMMVSNSYWYYKERDSIAAKWAFYSTIGLIAFYSILSITGMIGYISFLYD